MPSGNYSRKPVGAFGRSESIHADGIPYTPEPLKAGWREGGAEHLSS
jgi:hypothetical protein